MVNEKGAWSCKNFPYIPFWLPTMGQNMWKVQKLAWCACGGAVELVCRHHTAPNGNSHQPFYRRLCMHMVFEVTRVTWKLPLWSVISRYNTASLSSTKWTWRSGALTSIIYSQVNCTFVSDTADYMHILESSITACFCASTICALIHNIWFMLCWYL